MNTAEIRRRFLDYFATRGHEVVPSAPLLYNDPTLLFVNAGMVYFKAEAIRYAWELVTGSQEAGGLGFDPDRVWVTVLHSDDEAAALWASIAGLPPERIQRRGLLDNYWNMGIPGPGGLCSE